VGKRKEQRDTIMNVPVIFLSIFQTLSSTLTIIEVIIAIGFLIFIHELGHFLLAKLTGVRVEIFSLGFGPRLFGIKKGETEYRASLIPLGGYVKMAGENPGEQTGQPYEFTSKPVGIRALIVVAGVVAHAIGAVLPVRAALERRLGRELDALAAGCTAALAAGGHPGKSVNFRNFFVNLRKLSQDIRHPSAQHLLN